MRQRPRLRKLEANQRLHDFVQYGLSHEWPPEQISGKLRNDTRMIVRHER
jgi:IS30 family transposase